MRCSKRWNCGSHVTGYIWSQADWKTEQSNIVVEVWWYGTERDWQRWQRLSNTSASPLFYQTCYCTRITVTWWEHNWPDRLVTDSGKLKQTHVSTITQLAGINFKRLNLLKPTVYKTRRTRLRKSQLLVWSSSVFVFLFRIIGSRADPT